MKPETTIQCGAFELLEPIGEGGMGQVWRGRHRRQAVPVAVKVMSSEAFEGDDGMAMFRHEVQAQAGLHHPAIATVFDYGQIGQEAAEASESLEHGSPFLVMPLAKAGTLADSDRPARWSQVETVTLTILDALAHAHARNVIHRDLKPDNILCFPEADERARWRLCDFGIAHATDRVRDRGTQDTPHAGAGTPLYMAPEQLRGQWREFGPWTDLYQLGCMVYEFICGHPPYTGESFAQIITGHAAEPIPDLEPSMAVPLGTEAWVKTLLAKEPAGRFRRAADAARALLRLDAEDAVFEPESSRSQTEAEKPRAPEATTIVESAKTTLVLTALQDTVPASVVEDETAPLMRQAGAIADVDVVVPDSWRLDDREHSSQDLAEQSRFVDVGLGLFGLREIPFVDRIEERDRIWQGLREVSQTEAARCLVIEGLSGTGKSRLAEWMAQRAHELGACTLLRATHGRHRGPADGLNGMLRRWAQAWGLEREACFELIERRLAAYRFADDEKSGRREELAAGLTEMLYPTSDEASQVDGPRYRIESARQTYALISRLLGRLETRRPVILWLDDLHRGPQTAAFADFVFELLESPAVFIIATVQKGDPAVHEGAMERLDALRDRERVETMSLEPLAADDQAELIERLVPLAPDLVRQVSARTEGHPLFAVQLVGDWIARGRLEATDRGFALTDAASEELPDDLHQVWRRRIERVLENLPKERRSDALRALELGAALGRQVDPDEWHHACRRAGVDVPARLEAELADRGLIESGAEGWRFIHGMLVESLLKFADEQRRLEANHRVCAEMLEELYADSPGEVGERCADHWLAAGAPQRALAPLLAAADHARERGDWRHEAQLLERRGALLNDCDPLGDDRQRGEQLYRLARNYREQGRIERAEKLAAELEELARSQQLTDLCARALRLRATLDWNRGDGEAAAQKFDRAESVARDLDDPGTLAAILSARAQLAQFQGEPEKCRKLSEAAREHYRAVADKSGELWCVRGIAQVEIARGRYERAEAIVWRAIEEAREACLFATEINLINLLGDIARMREDWEAAEDLYERIYDLEQRLGRCTVVVAKLNLALVDAGIGRWSRARERLVAIEPKLPQLGYQYLLVFVELGKMGAAASRRDWESFEDHLRTLDELLDELDYREYDLPWLADRVGDACLEAGAPSRAREVFDIARRLRADLDTETHS